MICRLLEIPQGTVRTQKIHFQYWRNQLKENKDLSCKDLGANNIATNKANRNSVIQKSGFDNKEGAIIKCGSNERIDH